MDAVWPVLMAVGILGAALASFWVARRFGALAGLVIPAAAAVGLSLRQSSPLAHAEAAMGRGIELFFLWSPLVGLTLIGWGIGVLVRRRR